MHASRYLLATVKETPADAVVLSHRLMLRAGMIRKLASGLYTWLPTGLRVLQKVERIIREEMNNSGAQEVLMPVVQPMSLWEESGRGPDYGLELLRITDRHDNPFCLGPTHEEVITDLARNEIQSYKQLPVNFYQIQTKFRDEIRPRFGVMRSREFIMKDAYSFHLNAESLAETYEVMYRTYTRIFDRLGLDYRAVEADTGAIGGSASHEFHVLADSGEDDIALSDSSNYAANVELAKAPVSGERGQASQPMTKVDTPDACTIEDLTNQFDLTADKTVKTLIVAAADNQPQPLIALMVRGDHQLNDKKAEKLPEVASPFRMATEDEIRAAVGAGPGSLGPVGMPLPIIADHSVLALNDFVAGANEDGKHHFGINWERDVAMPKAADLRNVVEGDVSPDGQGKLTIRKGIEVGHIFQLGTKYSEKLGATVLDEGGKSVVMPMGCYGIGVTRVVAAAIEQNHDERGIIWPESLAPFDVILIPVNVKKSERERTLCEQLYQQLTEAGFNVLYDDREKERLGVKLADAELVGIPHRIVVGERGLDEKGTLEYRGRRDSENTLISPDDIISHIQSLRQR